MVETNKAVVRRFYEELLNQWRFEVLDQIVSEGVDFPLVAWLDGHRSRGVQGVDGASRIIFPDLQHRVDEMLAIEDRVVTRVTYSGTHNGKLGDVEPTGAHVEYVGAADTEAVWRAIGKL